LGLAVVFVLCFVVSIICYRIIKRRSKNKAAIDQKFRNMINEKLKGSGKTLDNLVQAQMKENFN